MKFCLYGNKKKKQQKLAIYQSISYLGYKKSVAYLDYNLNTESINGIQAYY